MALSNFSAVIFILPCFVAALVFNATKRRGRQLPPGPPGLPLIGNVLQMPTKNEWLTFTTWGKTYGSLVHVSVFGSPILILNSPTVISDLFEKRGHIYSDRPILPMAGELMGYKDAIPLHTYDAKHREARKLLYTALAPHRMEDIYPVHEQKVADFLHRLLVSPTRFQAHIRHLVASVVFQVSHGYVVADDDPLVQLSERSNREFSMAVSPGAFLVDTLPMLQYIPDWFPGAKFKRTAKEWRETTEQLKHEPYNNIKDQVSRGVASPSFTRDLIERHPQPSKEEEELYRWTSIAFYAAGSDTTVSAISSFFLAMTLYPDAQQKAREELDKVIGPGSLPRFSDREKLPYIEALIKEVYRWNPVGPLGLPHKLVQDDVYEGYFLPAGSLVLANTWGVMHDPDVYSSPLKFMPERYLSPDDALPDPRSFAFGYGRRVCPGQHLADTSLFITVVSTLSMFKISNAIDQMTGLPGTIEPRYAPGIISHPEPFECLITPRHREADMLAVLGR